MPTMFGYAATHSPFDEGFARAEEAFNILGYFPIVQGVSGRLRELFGLIQLVTSVVCTLFMVLEIILTSDPGLKRERIFRAQKTLEYAWHGIANMLRGQLETLPVVSLGFIFYDFTCRFRWKYPHETQF